MILAMFSYVCFLPVHFGEVSFQILCLFLKLDNLCISYFPFTGTKYLSCTNKRRKDSFGLMVSVGQSKTGWLQGKSNMADAYSWGKLPTHNSQKQIVKGRTGDKNRQFQVMPPVIHLLQPPNSIFQLWWIQCPYDPLTFWMSHLWTYETLEHILDVNPNHWFFCLLLGEVFFNLIM